MLPTRNWCPSALGKGIAASAILCMCNLNVILCSQLPASQQGLLLGMLLLSCRMCKVAVCSLVMMSSSAAVVLPVPAC